MARILKSAKVDEIKGKVGNLVFAGVRGATAVKRHVQGPDRKSDSQMSVRSAFTIVKNSWLTLEAGVVDSWKRFAKGLSGTGYNFFLAANLAQERADDWRILTPLNYRVRSLVLVTMEPGPGEGEATISWVAGTAKPSDKVWAFVREVGTSEVLHEATWTADVSAGVVVVDGLTVGKKYRFYVAVYDAGQDEGDRFSASVECLGEVGVPAEIYFEAHHEDGDFREYNATEVVGALHAILVSTGWAKEGTYSVRVEFEDGEVGDKARARKFNALDQGSGATIFGSAWWFFPTGFGGEAYWDLMKIRQAGSPYTGMMVRMNDSNQLYIRDDVNGASYHQDSPIVIPTNQQCGVELEIGVHDSAGYVRLWQDGIVIVSQAGIDTLPSANYEMLEIGVSAIYTDWPGPDYFWFDEIYVQDQRKIV